MNSLFDLPCDEIPRIAVQEKLAKFIEIDRANKGLDVAFSGPLVDAYNKAQPLKIFKTTKFNGKIYGRGLKFRNALIVYIVEMCMLLSPILYGCLLLLAPHAENTMIFLIDLLIDAFIVYLMLLYIPAFVDIFLQDTKILIKAFFC